MTRRSFAPSSIELGAGNELAWRCSTACPNRSRRASSSRRSAPLEPHGPPHAHQLRDRRRSCGCSPPRTTSTTFPADSALSERVIFPAGAEREPRHGGRPLRAASPTTTAAPPTTRPTPRTTASRSCRNSSRPTTSSRFRISTLNGPAAQNKGMALFPRRIGGQYVMLSRRDRENLHLATSTDVRHWEDVPSCIARAAPGSCCRSATAARPSRPRPAGW